MPTFGEPKSVPKIQFGVSLAIGTFWSTVSLVNFVISLIKKGPKKIFTVNDHRLAPACLSDDEYGIHSFTTTSTGVKIHYVAAGNANSPLMIFLHGFPENWYSWRHQISYFKSKFRTVAIDMRGYGESGKPEGVQNYWIPYLVEDVKDVMEALGYKNCVLVAHDWGGAVAWSVAAKYPEIINKLIICNCPQGTAFQKILKTDRKQFLKSWYMFFFQIPYLPEFLIKLSDYGFIRKVFCSKQMGLQQRSLTEEEMEAFIYSISQPGALTATINYYRATFRYIIPKEYRRTIKVPSLVIWGTKDGALSTSMAELSCKFVEARSSVDYVDGASHWVQQDNPEQVNKSIDKFISETNDSKL
ncbi:DgyrCDS14309 [Dimorphilus gyrociliatus]|uniref:DgyrCDS14309 n=1 Tax=Dimorphilus gyrociliatus TaxID=2664684 RepID=A0A7I8WD91_9ANNE|nr:DgyrCDS14309 [Dimorphilus gyrociliatus]